MFALIIIAIVLAVALMVLVSPVRVMVSASFGYGRDHVEAETGLFWGAVRFSALYEGGRTAVEVVIGPWTVRPILKKKPRPAAREPEAEAPAERKKPRRWVVSWWRVLRDYRRPAVRALSAFYRRMKPRLSRLDTRLGFSDPAKTGYLCGLKAALDGIGLPPGTWVLRPDFTASRNRGEVALQLDFLIARILYAGLMFLLWAVYRMLEFLISGRRLGYFRRPEAAKEFAL